MSQIISHNKLHTFSNYAKSLYHQFFPKRSVIWVDLDNVIGMVELHRPELHPTLLNEILPFLDQLGQNYDGRIEIKAYGNLRKHRIDSLAGVHHLRNKVSLIDTPYEPDLGSTATDPIMMNEMIATQSSLQHCMVVTSDVDFYPICESMRQHDIGVDLLALGFISWRLKKSVDKKIDSGPYLSFLQSNAIVTS